MLQCARACCQRFGGCLQYPFVGQRLDPSNLNCGGQQSLSVGYPVPILKRAVEDGPGSAIGVNDTKTGIYDSSSLVVRWLSSLH